jgi:hypothetical protein
MRILPLFASCILFISGCQFFKQKTEETSTVVLTEATIYNKDLVLQAARSPKDSKEADKLFLKAIDEYRNAHKPQKSIGLFVKSAILTPQARTYYELANALMDVKKEKEAIQAYTIAEALDYKPLSKLFFNKACAYSRTENADSSYYYLMAAIEFGYSNLKNALKDPDLAFLRDRRYDLQSEVMNAMAGVSDPEKVQWQLFSNQFKPVHFPCRIDTEYVSKLDPNQIISYEFEVYVTEMKRDKFTRDVGSEFYYVGLVKNDSAFKSLIYAVNEEVYEDQHARPYYYLVSYTNNGKLIDKMIIAGQETFKDPFRVATLNANGDIDVVEYTNQWEKDPEKEGYDNNKVLSRTEVGKKRFYISPDGHILPKTQELAIR